MQFRFAGVPGQILTPGDRQAGTHAPHKNPAAPLALPEPWNSAVPEPTESGNAPAITSCPDVNSEMTLSVLAEMREIVR